LALIEKKVSKVYICMEFKCQQATLNSWLKKMNIEYSGNQCHPETNVKPSSFYLKLNGPHIHTVDLKNKLIKEKIKEHKCEKCGRKKWNNLLIPLEFHHIDGNKFNNNIENIKLLCANCHSQTDGFRNRKEKKKKIKKEKTEFKYYCECGKEIKRRSKRCSICDKINQRKVKDRPTKEELILMVRETSLESVGRKYNVSGNAVKKWIK
jgi:hypothetical protein